MVDRGGRVGHRQRQTGAACRPLLGFVMVLSWSRQIFLRFFLNARMENFLRGHQAAFCAWQGCPRVLLYDNLKSAVLEQTLAALTAVLRPDPAQDPQAPAPGEPVEGEDFSLKLADRGPRPWRRPARAPHPAGMAQHLFLKFSQFLDGENDAAGLRLRLE